MKVFLKFSVVLMMGGMPHFDFVQNFDHLWALNFRGACQEERHSLAGHMVDLSA